MSSLTDPVGSTTRLHPRWPIFRLDAGADVVLYTPGRPRVTNQLLAGEVQQALLSGTSHEVADALLGDAIAAAGAWRALAGRKFEPECLTLYLSNRCSLACTYCYSRPPNDGRARGRLRVYRPSADERDFPVLSEHVIEAAANLVAGHCAAKGNPLTLVLHGGGEPTAHWDLLTRVWAVCSRIAAAHGVRLWSYVATHGVLADDRVRWLAEHFDLVGVSCDGPPSIQDENRPSASNAATSAALERTVHLLAELDADYLVRTTIARASMARQREVVEFLCESLHARAIQFEPAYGARHRQGEQFLPDDADFFVRSFFAARDAARARGCDLQLSGVRIDELHGPFCNPLRDVLQLTPDGTASACFLSVGNGDAVDDAMMMGRLDPDTGRFLVDEMRVAWQCGRAALIPDRCHECHNVFHCARDCPDVCLLEMDKPRPVTGGFRCRVQQQIGRQTILEAAKPGSC